ncbi:Predicted gene 14743 [Apodemus speciosus]|uniref:Predicted gene 14743 n=1 Tax=Apodemus speciosus TaxID=105296 RepID=A0ABQ0FW25_APOSI
MECFFLVRLKTRNQEMEALLLLVLLSLTIADEKPLPLSGRFKTIYLASNDLKEIGENGYAGMFMRNVIFFKNYRKMVMTYYIRRHGECGKHTFAAQRPKNAACKSVLSILSGKECIAKNAKESVTGFWLWTEPQHHIPSIQTHKFVFGDMVKVPHASTIVINYISNTTMLFLMEYTHKERREIRLTYKKAKGNNITEEMREKYVKLTRKRGIPTENIKNMYEIDTCPK